MRDEINFPDEFPILSTERLELKAFESYDAEAYFNLRSDEDFMQYLDLYPMKKVSQARDRVHSIIQDFKTEKGISWKITTKGDETLIGYIGFWQIDFSHFRAEIGFGLNPELHNQGIMSEALPPILDYGFKQMGLHSIKGNVNPANEASILLLEHAGFEKEAHFRENYYFDGEFIDSAYYCILEQDWDK